MYRRRKAAQVADHAASKRDQRIGSGKSFFAQRGQRSLQRSKTLEPLAIADQVSVNFESGTFEITPDLFSVKTENLPIRDDQDPASVSSERVGRPSTAIVEDLAADDDVICRSCACDLDRDKNLIHPVDISKQKSREARARGRIDKICAGEATWKCTAPANS
jgi:hypothetical protein